MFRIQGCVHGSQLSQSMHGLLADQPASMCDRAVVTLTCMQGGFGNVGMSQCKAWKGMLFVWISMHSRGQSILLYFRTFSTS